MVNDNMDVIPYIKELMDKNQKHADLTSDMLLNIYHSANTTEQEIINKICVCLCGVSFDTVLKRLDIQL